MKPDNVFQRPTIAIDIDGTLVSDERALTDAGMDGRIRALNALRGDGWDVVVHTARPVSQYRRTEKQLAARAISWSTIVYGKPNADLFIDDRGLLLPGEAMEELAHLRAARHEDRESPWTIYARGGTETNFRVRLHQVGENPEALPDRMDPNFRIVIPLTGGLDSVTALTMAQELELPTACFYVDWGQEFGPDEIEVARTFDEDLTVIGEPLRFERTYRHVQVGRNPAFQWLVLTEAASRGWWGELWTGMHGEEAKIQVGDKSYRFNVTMSQLVAAEGLDFGIQHPLGGMTKTDCVTWLASRGRLGRALSTRTCFSAGHGHCGRCWACFQRWCAFGSAGYEEEHEPTMPDIDFTDALDQFRAKAASRTRSGRDPRVLSFLDFKGLL